MDLKIPNQGPCAQMLYTEAPKYLSKDYFKADENIVYEYMDP